MNSRTGPNLAKRLDCERFTAALLRRRSQAPQNIESRPIFLGSKAVLKHAQSKRWRAGQWALNAVPEFQSLWRL
jgi:hypothetical protein